MFYFLQYMSKESELHRIQYPSIVKVHTNIQDIQKREFKKCNIILYSLKTSLPVY